MNQTTSFTKRQRLFDHGYLIDLTRYNNRKPLACTFSVFDTLTRLDPKQSLKIDLNAILRYVMFMSQICFNTIDAETREFQVVLSRKTHTFRLVKTSDENGEHLTITGDFLELL